MDASDFKILKGIGYMNFIDKAFTQKLTGKDFLQAMAGIYSEPEIYQVLDRYPAFVKDVIIIIDYDTELQMEGLDEIIQGNLSDRYFEIVNALERCGEKEEVLVLKKARELYDNDEQQYAEKYSDLYNSLALNHDEEGFWNLVIKYINCNLNKM